MSTDDVAKPDPQVDQATLTDPKALRALSHPIRLALLEVLAVAGPLTATQAAERIGESPSTCSFHLRQLAKYGFVEEAGGGRGRQRPWRRTHLGWRVPFQADNPEFTLASQGLVRVLLQRYWQRLQRWLETYPAYPAEWQEASVSSEYAMYLTADELAELKAELHAVLNRFFTRYRDRYDDPSKRPASARIVEVLAYAYPIDTDDGR